MMERLFEYVMKHIEVICDETIDMEVLISAVEENFGKEEWKDLSSARGTERLDRFLYKIRDKFE